MEIGEFHSHDGLMFKRTEDGGVRIRRTGENAEPVILTASEWASVVASVSAQGESGATHAVALRFQNGEQPDLAGLAHALDAADRLVAFDGDGGVVATIARGAYWREVGAVASLEAVLAALNAASTTPVTASPNPGGTET